MEHRPGPAAGPLEPRAVPVAEHLHVSRWQFDRLRHRVVPERDVHDRALADLRRGLSDRPLNRRAVAAWCDLDDRPHHERRMRRDRRRRWIDVRSRDDAIADDDGWPFERDGACDRERVAHARDARAERRVPDNRRTAVLAPAPDRVVEHQPGTLIQEVNGRGIDRVENRVVLNVDGGRMVDGAQRDEERLRSDRVVVARGEEPRVLHHQIRDGRSAEHAPIHPEIAGARFVRDARAAVVEERVPDPRVERVEVAERDAGFRVANEAIAQDARLGEAQVVEAAVDAERHVHELVVGVLVAGVEERAHRVFRLIDGDRRRAAPVEREPRHARVHDAVDAQHRAALRAVPYDCCL